MAAATLFHGHYICIISYKTGTVINLPVVYIDFKTGCLCHQVLYAGTRDTSKVAETIPHPPIRHQSDGGCHGNSTAAQGHVVRLDPTQSGDRCSSSINSCH